MTIAATHPLRDFKITASVDWLRLKLTTPHPTQARHLRAKLPAAWRAFAAPAPGSDPNACSSWLLTIQDPPRAAVIAKTLLHVLGLLPDQIAADAIEVSLDLLPRNQSAYSRLDEAAYHLHRHHAHPPPGTPRITERDHYRAAAGRRDILQALRDGFTVNTATHKDADHRSRTYVKRTDSGGDKKYHPLPQAQHRARLEVTLSGDALRGIAPTLADLMALRFETLTSKLALVADTETTASPLTAMLRPLQTQRGRARTPGARRQSRQGTRRDTATNKRIHDALRSLSARWTNAEISGQNPDLGASLTEGDGLENGDSPKYLICQTTDTTQTSQHQPTAQRQQAGRTRPEGADGPHPGHPGPDRQGDQQHQREQDGHRATRPATTGPAGPAPGTAQDARADEDGHRATADLVPPSRNWPKPEALAGVFLCRGLLPISTSPA